MSALDIHQIPVFSDNYIYLAKYDDNNNCVAVDPADPSATLAALDELGWNLTHILNTHHHPDHTGGNTTLKEAKGCTIVGSVGEAANTPGIDVEVQDGDALTLGGHKVKIIGTPGHTSGHISFWFEDALALFCGDTLFSMGCGRVFEGTPAQMWDSLKKLRELPDDTKICCAHEYTEANVAFSLSIEPDNADLKKRADEVAALRAEGKPTVPSRMGEEKKVNPFLRGDVAETQAAIGMAGQDATAVFTEIRHRKDVF
ncbi:MAG: hydroxyacylglutathione hydrolase [Alphaproteobacteria bacterium]|nr:hydroxyacylglutathione hydrolase [Rhodospirillales bacterium]MCW9045518.1 hydroxyacylglutathione hydrolase [Alphaproteobacteria bacterium]